MNAPPDLLALLRQKLAEAERELQNPVLLDYTRRQLKARAERLALEITELEQPTRFAEWGGTIPPTPLRGGNFCQQEGVSL